eukprot:scaffold180369_cov13-Tisochrysis_lutea.AAC.1
MSIDAYPFIPGQARGVAADVVLTRNTSTHATHLMKHQQSKRQAMVQLTHTAHPHQTSLKLSVARSPPFTPLLLDAPSKNDILLLRAVLLPPSVAQALRGFTLWLFNAGRVAGHMTSYDHACQWRTKVEWFGHGRAQPE